MLGVVQCHLCRLQIKVDRALSLGELLIVHSESLDIERFHFRRAILDLEQVAPLVDGGLLRTFTIDGESV